MKKICHKIAAVLMSLVVLFSTMSFSVSMHYCGDNLVDRTIFKDATTCGMEVSKTSDTYGCQLLKKNCCSNKKIVIQGQNELKTPPYQFLFNQQFFITAFIYHDTHFSNILAKNNAPYQGHSPPFLVRDIYILNQTFLI